MLAQILGRTPGLGVPRRVERDVQRLVNPPGVTLGFAMAKEDKAPRARLERPLCRKPPDLVQAVLPQPGLPDLERVVRCHETACVKRARRPHFPPGTRSV